MKRVFCIGEALIDFICTDIDVDLSHGSNFLKKAGGAPANVAASVAKLGGQASFCGKVGSDAFGKFLIDEMRHHGIDCSHVVIDEVISTTLAFVSLKSDGERDFEFFRGADGNLKYDEIVEFDFDRFNLYHFGSATGLLDGILYETYMELLRYAKGSGKIVSFDPNYRKLLWDAGNNDTQTFTKRVKACLKYVDFIKLSDEEAHLIFGHKDYEAIAEEVHSYGVKTVAITCGKEGAFLSVKNSYRRVDSMSIEPLDSTGAGDAFVGAMLYKLACSEKPEEDLENIVNMNAYTTFSNRVGAITCTKYGAMEAMPTLEEVKKNICI